MRYFSKYCFQIWVRFVDRLSEMEAFINVVDNSGFTGAAKRLGISKSAVSKHISALEERLGARLLDRTTRRVSPTEIGMSYYDRAKRVLTEAADADQMVTSMQSSPRGLLKISVPVSFGALFAGRAITAFLAAFPDVKIDLVLDDRFADIISDGYDLALRIGALPNSSLKVRKIAETQSLLVASPDYLGEFGTPNSIDDLLRHKLLHYSMLSNGNSWRIVSRTGEERQIRTGGSLTANNGDVLVQAMIDGLGIGFAPSFFLCDHLKSGALKPILTDHPQPITGIHLVYPPGLYTQPKTRAFIDFMVEYFKGKGPKDW